MIALPMQSKPPGKVSVGVAVGQGIIGMRNRFKKSHLKSRIAYVKRQEAA